MDAFQGIRASRLRLRRHLARQPGQKRAGCLPRPVEPVVSGVSREQWYVSVSRAKQRVTIYTDDKQALRKAVMQSDDRPSATEFINGKAKRLGVDLNRRERESPR